LDSARILPLDRFGSGIGIGTGTFGSKRQGGAETVNVTPSSIIPSQPYHSRSSSHSPSKSQGTYLDSLEDPYTQPIPRRSNMRPSPLNPNPTPNPMTLPVDLWETPQSQGSHRHHSSSRRGGILDDMPEGIEDDAIHGLSPGRGLLSPHASNASIASRGKADKILGLETGARLASFYLVSGLPKVSDYFTA
jgi:hypothetical protein